jgi:hypothetical protein
MKRHLLTERAVVIPILFFGFLASTAAQAPADFAFPPDGSGKELANKLPPPGQGTFPVIPAAEKKPAKIPSSVTNPTVRPAPSSIIMPLLQPQIPAAPSQPAAIAEAAPLEEYGSFPLVPEVPQIAVGPPVRVPSVDVNLAPILVQVKQPAAEPAVFPDPTEDASLSAALACPLPPRTEAAPLLRLYLPDPFANRNDTSGLTPLPESDTPITATPIVPGA